MCVSSCVCVCVSSNFFENQNHKIANENDGVAFTFELIKTYIALSVHEDVTKWNF